MTISGNDSNNGKYYTAGFAGEDGKMYIVSIYADKDDAMKKTLWNYASDTKTLVGDLVISGCFKVKSFDNIEDMSDTSSC